MNIKFDRHAKACAQCGTPFKDEEKFVTALATTEEDAVFFRQDICQRCWPSQDAARYYCHWETTFSANFKPLLLDADTLWQVFARSHLQAFQDPQMAEFAYVAALALMRLKQLVLEDNGVRDGQSTMLFRTRGKVRATYEVPDCDLNEAALTRVQDALEAFLESANGEGDDSDDADGGAPTGD